MNHLKNFSNYIKENVSTVDPFLDLSNIIKRKELKDNEDYWQAILDYGYNKWQDEDDNSVTSYFTLVSKVIEDLGEVYGLFVLLGKYNQQVYNGGHVQYHDNGYDSSERSGAFSNDYGNIDLHEKMVELFQKHGFNQLKDGDKVFDILKDYTISNAYCDDCDGNGEYNEDCYQCDGTGEIENNEEEEFDTCDVCNGSGEDSGECSSCYGSGEIENEYEVENPDVLDTRYYKISSDWEKTLGEKAKSIIKADLLKRKINIILN